MTKPTPLSPFGFLLLFWETRPGRFPEASRSWPRYPAGQGLWEGPYGLHSHPRSKVDLEKLKRRPQEWPVHVDTHTHAGVAESFKQQEPVLPPGPVSRSAPGLARCRLSHREMSPRRGSVSAHPSPGAHLLQHLVQRLSPRQAVGAQATRLAALRAQCGRLGANQ